MRRRVLNSWTGLGASAKSAVRFACATAMLAALAAPAQAAEGDIFTFAGTGAAGFGGDGGPATSAGLQQPISVAWLGDGGALVADFANHRIRRISASGEITTVAGTGTAGYSGDGGPATSAKLNWPLDVEPTADGGFLIADLGNKRIRRVSPAGVITTVAGTGQGGSGGDGGPATLARLSPTGVAGTADGGFLVADAGAHRVRRVSPDGTITRVAGTGTAGGAGDGGPAFMAELNTPVDVATLPDGGYLITEYEGQRVRRVSPAGVITRVAGNGTAGFSGDGGAATAARLNKPIGVSTTADGGFLIGDTVNHTVRRVAADGTISTVAGTGESGYAGDGAPAVSAQLRSPAAAAETTNGAILIADTEDNRLRLVEGRPSPDGPTPPDEPPHTGAAPAPGVHASATRVLRPIACPPTAAEACRGTIRVFMRRAALRASAAATRRILVARSRYSVAAGESKLVRVRLTRAGRRVLRKRRRGTVTAVVSRRGGPNIGQSSQRTTYRYRYRRPGARTAGSHP